MKLLNGFSKIYAARIIESIFNYLTFQDVTHPIVKSKMSTTAAYNTEQINVQQLLYIKRNML